MEHLGSLNSVNDLEKLPRLRREYRLKSIHSSIAIENNTLSLGEVNNVIEGKNVSGNKDEILAVKNAFEVYKLIPSFKATKLQDLIKAHGIMMKDLVGEAGALRSKGVGVFEWNGNISIRASPSRHGRNQYAKLFHG